MNGYFTELAERGRQGREARRLQAEQAAKEKRRAKANIILEEWAPFAEAILEFLPERFREHGGKLSVPDNILPAHFSGDHGEILYAPAALSVLDAAPIRAWATPNYRGVGYTVYLEIAHPEIDFDEDENCYRVAYRWRSHLLTRGAIVTADRVHFSEALACAVEAQAEFYKMMKEAAVMNADRIQDQINTPEPEPSDPIVAALERINKTLTVLCNILDQ